MFENKKTQKGGIHYSRYIASWLRMGGRIPDGGVYNSQLFIRWLESEGLTPEEINDVMRIVDNGKMELEFSASKFLNEHKQEWTEEKECNFYAGHRI